MNDALFDMTHASIKGRVAKGAALLDEVKPGWFWEIDDATLDLMDVEFCIIGQLFGGWTVGCAELEDLSGIIFISDGYEGNPSRGNQEAHGFELKMSEYHGEVMWDQILTSEWYVQIASRVENEAKH